MEPLVLIGNRIEEFLNAAREADYNVSLRSRNIIRTAKRLQSSLKDPLVLWGDLNDDIRKDLVLLAKEVKHYSPRQSNEKLVLAKKSLHDALNDWYVDNEATELESLSQSEATGKLRQLTLRQNEINSAVASSVIQISERTGAAERQIERVQRKYINELRTESSQLRELYSNEIKVLVEDSSNDLEKTVETANSRLNQIIRDATDELLKKHSSEYNRLYSELKSKTEEQIRFSDDSRADFEEKLQSLNRIHEAQILELNDRFSQEQNSFKDRFLSEVKKEIQQYKGLRTLLKEQLNEAKDIVGVLSKKALAHEHLIQAGREAKAYWGFQLFGLSFLFLAILMSVAIFGDSLGLKIPWLTWLVDFSSSNGELSTYNIVNQGSLSKPPSTPSSFSSEASWFFKRISIVILLTAPGLYLLKEAANHRAKENLYRQRGVQLASITPYLKELDEQERNSIKKELVTSFFSFHDGKADTQNVPDFLRDLKETTKIIRSIDRATQPTTNNRTYTPRRKRRPQASRG